MAKQPNDELTHLLDTVKTLHLSTLNSEGNPSISYSPFIVDHKGYFYIFVSQLAAHTKEILEHTSVAILLINDESMTKQLFARTRVTYQCEAEVVMLDDDVYQSLLDAFNKKFGSIMTVLQSLPDFMLFRLIPQSGRFVMGFGQAFELSGKQLQRLDPITVT